MAARSWCRRPSAGLFEVTDKGKVGRPCLLGRLSCRRGVPGEHRRHRQQPSKLTLAQSLRRFHAGASSAIEHGTCKIVERPSKLDGKSIVASIVVYATVDQVVRVLTEYKKLPSILPNLADCQVLSNPATGVTRLKQTVRVQSGLWKLEADAVLDVSMRKLPLGVREVRFATLGGSFKRLSGRWLVEPVESVATGVLTRISYEVDAEPLGTVFFLDMQKMVRSILASNLFALARYIESTSKSWVPAPGFLSSALGEVETPKIKNSAAVPPRRRTDAAKRKLPGGPLAYLGLQSVPLPQERPWDDRSTSMDMAEDELADIPEGGLGDGDLEANGNEQASMEGDAAEADAGQLLAGLPKVDGVEEGDKATREASRALAREITAVDCRRLDSGNEVRRRVVASVHVAAPVETVWRVLTEYEALPEHVPSLESCVRVPQPGAPAGLVRLRQVGTKTLPYLTLRAMVELDVMELPLREIQFRQTSGSFTALQGKWILQPVEAQEESTMSSAPSVSVDNEFPDCGAEGGERSQAPGSGDAPCTVLKYAVEVVFPQALIAMGSASFQWGEPMMERVTFEDLPVNLCGLKAHAERLYAQETQEILERTYLRFRAERPRRKDMIKSFPLLQAELLRCFGPASSTGMDSRQLLMPTRADLRAARRADLERAIEAHGGPVKVARRMGWATKYKRKPKGYWLSFENVAAEIMQYNEQDPAREGVMPSVAQLKESRNFGLAKAVEQFGGMAEVGEVLGLEVRTRRGGSGAWHAHVAEVAECTGLCGGNGLFELASRTYRMPRKEAQLVLQAEAEAARRREKRLKEDALRSSALDPGSAEDSMEPLAASNLGNEEQANNWRFSKFDIDNW